MGMQAPSTWWSGQSDPDGSDESNCGQVMRAGQTLDPRQEIKVLGTFRLGEELGGMPNAGSTIRNTRGSFCASGDALATLSPSWVSGAAHWTFSRNA